MQAASSTRPDARAWFVLAMLCLVYVLNFLDRQLLSILAKPIQDELQVSDGQLGLISGLYFALFYCLISIPVGWLADRTNRVRVLAASCAIWSAATVACGMASSYPQLVLARMTVGIGEAGGVPPSYAIISDYFPPGMRGKALGLFNLGPPLGQAMGIAFGASIAMAYNWRWAFIVLGGVGILAALAVYLFVREPVRGRLDPAPAVESGPAPGLWQTMGLFFRNPVLLLVSLASGSTQFVTYALLNFTTLFLMREKGMGLEEVAIHYALLVGVCICGSMYVSGWLVDRYAKRWHQAYAWIPGVGLALALPFFIGFINASSWSMALLFLAGPLFFNYFYLSPAVALVQEEVAPRERVLAGALLLLVMNLIGLGLGPTWLGAASDYFGKTDPGNSLKWAFYTLIPCYLLSIGLYAMLARRLRLAKSSRGDM